MQDTKDSSTNLHPSGKKNISYTTSYHSNSLLCHHHSPDTLASIKTAIACYSKWISTPHSDGKFTGSDAHNHQYTAAKKKHNSKKK